MSDPSGTFKLKLPSKSVIDPIPSDPLTETVAPGSGFPVSSNTTPLTMESWAIINEGNIKSIIKNFFICLV